MEAADAVKDTLGLDSFTVFEIEELMNLAPKYGLPVLLYLFRRLERSLHGQPAAIFLDEAWIMLGHAVFRDKIREWLKVMPKANCVVLMATQSLSDSVNSGILDVIIESTATKIFLPNAFAPEEDATALYRRFGLNERQIEIIAGSVPKRDYYYVSERGRRLYELALGPLALSFVGVSDKDSVAEVKKCEARFGTGWKDEWLRRRGLSLSQYVGHADEQEAVGGGEGVDRSMKSWWRKEAMAAMPVDNGQVEQSPNPYLDARWQWNSQVDRAFGAAHAWQIMGIAGLLIGLGGSCRDHLRRQPKQVCAVRDRGEWFGGGSSGWAGAVGRAGRSTRGAGVASLVHRFGAASHPGRFGPARRYFPG
jgi:hypothetical protein